MVSGIYRKSFQVLQKQAEGRDIVDLHIRKVINDLQFESLLSVND